MKSNLLKPMYVKMLPWKEVIFPNFCVFETISCCLSLWTSIFLWSFYRGKGDWIHWISGKVANSCILLCSFVLAFDKTRALWGLWVKRQCCSQTAISSCGHPLAFWDVVTSCRLVCGRQKKTESAYLTGGETGRSTTEIKATVVILLFLSLRVPGIVVLLSIRFPFFVSQNLLDWTWIIIQDSLPWNSGIMHLKMQNY